MSFVSRLRCFALGTALLASPALATAQGNQPPVGFSGEIGFGVASLPTYAGSPNRRTLAGPDFSLSYRSTEWGTVEFGARGLMWSPSTAEALLRYGLVAAVDLGRLDRTPSRFNPTPGDDRLSSLYKVERSLEAGAFLGLGPLMVTARKGLGNEGHGGTRVDLSLGHGFELTDTLGLKVEARAEWADSRYMKAYHGLIKAQTTAPFAAFSAQDGWVQHSLTVGADWEFLPKWHVRFALTGSYVGDEAAKSPLVVKRKATTAGLSVVYAF